MRESVGEGSGVPAQPGPEPLPPPGEALDQGAGDVGLGHGVGSRSLVGGGEAYTAAVAA
jgi:hypothetical protein